MPRARTEGWVARLGVLSHAARNVVARAVRLPRAAQRLAPHVATGRRGEAMAARYLRGLGMRVLARNLRTAGGEIDLLCRDREGTLVVVEVKTRAPDQPIRPEAAINADKRRRLLASARAIRRSRAWRGAAVRIDVVIIELTAGEPTIRHYVNAVSATP